MSSKKGKATKASQAKDTDGDYAPEETIKKKPKFNYYAHLNAAPSALGSKEIPVGKPDCLQGSTFVITGQLSSITREDTADLIKKYGGRVTSAVSGKTTYLVVGEEPGESKRTKAKSLKVPELTEDQLFDLIRNSESSVQPAVTSKKADPVEPKADKKPTKPPAKNPNLYQFLTAAPSAPGSKEVPQGKPDCLAGMTFVVTGQLSSIDRDATTELIQSLGGRVTSGVSGKTTYLLVGEEPGETKIRKANSIGTPKLDEDQFFAFIRSFEDAAPAEENPKESSPSSQPDNDPTQSKPVSSTQKTKVTGALPRPSTSEQDDSQLWVDRYKPKTIKELCGNNSNISRLVKFLTDWDPNGQEERAVLISGKPGIGKTTSAQLACKEAGYTAIEFNASDSRSKKSIEAVLAQFIDNHSISEFFRPVSEGKAKTKPKTTKTAVILDEIDGMSGGDRGGVAEIIKYIKRTKIPIICICNDAKSVKVRSLANHCIKLSYSKPMVTSVKSRIDMIAKKEGLSLGTNVIDKLFEMSGGDIRQTINLLSTWRLSKSSMSYDEGKDYSKSVQKNTLLDPFKVTAKYLSASEYQAHSFSDRLEFYFHDFQIVPLMVQENYIRTRPSGINRNSDPELAEVELLEKLSQAADAICEGDLVDRSIHISQNWGLMPVHAAFSCCIPSYYMHGVPAQLLFPQWLGKNSSAGKFSRLLKEAHLHMRTRISGDKNELRQSYLPTLSKKLVGPLIEHGQDGIDQVIKVMDYYHLDKEDWDAIIELRTGADKVKALLQKIPTSSKSAFTRAYNKSSHPTVVHHTPSSGRAREKSLSTAEAAVEIEDALAAEDDTVEINDESEEENSETDPQDSLLKKRKSTTPAATRGGKKTRGKK